MLQHALGIQEARRIQAVAEHHQQRAAHVRFADHHSREHAVNERRFPSGVAAVSASRMQDRFVESGHGSETT